MVRFGIMDHGAEIVSFGLNQMEKSGWLGMMVDLLTVPESGKQRMETVKS